MIYKAKEIPALHFSNKTRFDLKSINGMSIVIAQQKNVLLQGNAQFVQKVSFEPLMDFKQNHYRSWKQSIV